MSDNHDLINAAATTTTTLGGSNNANGGLLNVEQANSFIDLTVDSSVVLKMARVLRPGAVAGEFGRLSFGEPVTESAEENETGTNTSSPTHTKIDFRTTKLRSMLDITTEVYEENIEGEGYENTVMASLGKRIGTDHELLAIRGDTVAYAAVATALGRLLKRHDGWYKQSLSGHTVDCAGGSITRTIFSKMIRSMPWQFKQNRAALRFFAGPSIVQDYRDYLVGQRATAYGDAILQGDDVLRVFGVPITEVPLIPEDLDSYDGSETWGDGSWLWLTWPTNLVHVISREIETYFQFVPRKDTTEVTIYTRTDDIIENVDGMVLGYDVRVAGAS